MRPDANEEPFTWITVFYCISKIRVLSPYLYYLLYAWFLLETSCVKCDFKFMCIWESVLEIDRYIGVPIFKHFTIIGKNKKKGIKKSYTEYN